MEFNEAARWRKHNEVTSAGHCWLVYTSAAGLEYKYAMPIAQADFILAAITDLATAREALNQIRLTVQYERGSYLDQLLTAALAALNPQPKEQPR